MYLEQKNNKYINRSTWNSVYIALVSIQKFAKAEKFMMCESSVSGWNTM